jgi:hypothetical protein
MVTLRVLGQVDERIADGMLPRGQDDDDPSLRALSAAAAELEGLVAEAEALAGRLQPLVARERAVSERERQAALLSEELGRREHELAVVPNESAEAVTTLRREERRLDELGLRLGPQAGMLDRGYRDRWRRAWQRRPRLGDSNQGQACDLLFLPTPQGYALLGQSGLTLRRGARLTLSPGGPEYVVLRIACWPFDGRWCAYLQQET